jgi:hypothetical protein
MLKFYARFEINDQTGDPLTDHDMMQLHYDRITALQKAAFVKYAELRRFALTNVASINTREALTKHFESLRYGMNFFLLSKTFGVKITFYIVIFQYDCIARCRGLPQAIATPRQFG